MFVSLSLLNRNPEVRTCLLNLPACLQDWLEILQDSVNIIEQTEWVSLCSERTQELRALKHSFFELLFVRPKKCGSIFSHYAQRDANDVASCAGHSIRSIFGEDARTKLASVLAC